MSKDKKQIIEFLLTRYLSGSISVAEQKLLFELLEQEKDNTHWEQVLEELMAAENESEPYNREAWKPVLQLILTPNTEKIKTGKIRRFKNLNRWVAAAAIITAMFGIGIYFYFNHTAQKLLANTSDWNQIKNDIAPGGNKAILTLADGSTIALDSAHNGTLSKQGNTKVVKLANGQLAYNLFNQNKDTLVYNTITTPKTGQYKLVLSDGSKVWLNASSSLRFPANFMGNERKVTLTGEAYFEVVHNAAQPFKIAVAGKGEVEVLGTHFNINAYSDEASIKTTLLEGKVKETSFLSNNSVLLMPGQQASLNANGEIAINKNIDEEEVMAWKNGLFNFNSMELPAIMRQISRWYDVEVIYEGKISKETYSGIISRNSNISEVLKIIEAVGVKYKCDGKQIIVHQ